MNSLEKQLQVLAKSLVRNEKDLKLYELEKSEQCLRIENMRETDQDSHDIAKQLEVLGETEQMIPLAQERIEKCRISLGEFIEINGSQFDTKNEQLIFAKELHSKYQY